MIYQGDTISFILSIAGVGGSTPALTTAPTVQILYLATDTPMLTTPGQMVLVSGSTSIYKYNWLVPANAVNGQYIALAFYVANGNVYNGQLLEKFQIGDTMITGTLALNSTVAKDATVAKDLTVAHLTDVVSYSPDNSATVLAIKAKTDTLPVGPASEASLASLTSLLTDVHDVSLGNIVINKAVTPPTMSFMRLDGSVLAVFNLNETTNTTSREQQ